MGGTDLSDLWFFGMDIGVIMGLDLYRFISFGMAFFFVWGLGWSGG